MVKKRGRKEAKVIDSPKERIESEFFYHLSLGQSLEELDEKEVKKITAEIQGKFLDSLRAINEEIIQLSEFIIEDEKLAQEICRLIIPILKHLNRSFTIPANTIPLFKRTSQIILNEDGHLVFVYDNNRINSKSLDEYPPETILTVFLYIIPELGRVLRLYRRKIGMRVNLFEKIYRELENANRTITDSNRSPTRAHDGDLEPVEIDGVKKTLFSKKNEKSSESRKDGGQHGYRDTKFSFVERFL